MKKFLCLFTVFAMLLCLFAGCGSNEEPDVGGVITNVPSSSANEPTAEPSAEPSTEPSVEPEEEEPSPEPAEEPEEEFDTGIVIGGTYTNEFVGISCTLDENWMYLDESQMAEINGLAVDSVTDEDIKAQMEASGVFYDMYAMSLDGYYTMSIAFEDLGLLYGTILSESDYVDIAIGQLPATLESAGFADVSCEKSSVEFCGAEHAVINISGTMDEVPIFETLVCLKSGSYMALLTIASLVENDCYELLELFSAA